MGADSGTGSLLASLAEGAFLIGLELNRLNPSAFENLRLVYLGKVNQLIIRSFN